MRACDGRQRISLGALQVRINHQENPEPKTETRPKETYTRKRNTIQRERERRYASLCLSVLCFVFRCVALLSFHFLCSFWLCFGAVTVRVMFIAIWADCKQLVHPSGNLAMPFVCSWNSMGTSSLCNNIYVLNVCQTANTIAHRLVKVKCEVLRQRCVSFTAT